MIREKSAKLLLHTFDVVLCRAVRTTGVQFPSVVLWSNRLTAQHPRFHFIVPHFVHFITLCQSSAMSWFVLFYFILSLLILVVILTPSFGWQQLQQLIQFNPWHNNIQSWLTKLSMICCCYCYCTTQCVPADCSSKRCNDQHSVRWWQMLRLQKSKTNSSWRRQQWRQLKCLFIWVHA